MPQRYRRIQEQLFTFVRDQFGLSDPEALLVLDDIVLNLEAMAADLVPREDIHIDPCRAPERILQSLTALADRLRCPMLADIVANLAEADATHGQPLPDKAVEPLLRFVHGLRKAMPPVHREYGD